MEANLRNGYVATHGDAATTSSPRGVKRHPPQLVKRIRKLIAFGASACALMASLAGGCTGPSQRSESHAATASRRDKVSPDRPDRPERHEGWLGVVLPRQSLDLAPEIAGQVEQVHVRIGDPVRRGQTVATLRAAHDRQELVITEDGLRAAEAEVSRVQLELAEAENRLSSRLAMPDAFPKEEIRRAEIQKEMAAVRLEGARAAAAAQRARVVQARDRLAKAEVRAPADGTVTRRYVEAGGLAGPAQPIVRLIGDSRLIVRFAVPPEEARSLRAEGRVQIAVDAGNVPAVIEWVSPEIDPPSGMVILVAVLDPPSRVKPGSVVRVHLTSAAVRREGAV
ncbi:MAG TPA: efflux RND transporter periplasmic adaptor subunit [Thermoanaerobaculia bacterium]|nr:efflux RND transporter periplasmic adaptor subunit [Thermoanaerobaculia bacterium]